MKFSFLLLSVALFFIECRKKDAVTEQVAVSPFEATPIKTSILPGLMDEASGIADCKSMPGNIWVHQDRGNQAQLILLSHSGTIRKRIFISGAHNRDWEDMARASGPVDGRSYIYIAESGDNSSIETTYSIFRFEEPSAATDTVKSFERIVFKYPDGSHDAEAMFVDNTTKDIFIITKRDAVSRLYKLAYPQQTTGTSTAVLAGVFTFSGATGAAASDDGKEILIKTYTSIYYWKKQSSETIETLLAKKPLVLDYETEPQGEALCFTSEGSGFFTLSERPSFISAVSLNLYKRK